MEEQIQPLSEEQRDLCEKIYRRYHDRIRQYVAAVLKDDDEAENIAQDVFVILAKKLLDRKYIHRTMEEAGGWLYHVAFKEYSKYRRKTWRLTDLPDDYPSAAGDTDWKRVEFLIHARKTFRRVFPTLPPKVQKVVLGYLADEPKASIAARLNLTISTVNQYIYQARKAFKIGGFSPFFGSGY